MQIQPRIYFCVNFQILFRQMERVRMISNKLPSIPFSFPQTDRDIEVFSLWSSEHKRTDRPNVVQTLLFYFK